MLIVRARARVLFIHRGHAIRSKRILVNSNTARQYLIDTLPAVPVEDVIRAVRNERLQSCAKEKYRRLLFFLRIDFINALIR